MGRIGKSYPRFQPMEQEPLARREQKRIWGSRLAGAIVGLLAALGLIGFFLTR